MPSVCETGRVCKAHRGRGAAPGRPELPSRVSTHRLG